MWSRPEQHAQAATSKPAPSPMLFDGERALALGHATTSQVEEIEEFKEAFDAFVHSACDDHEKIGQKEIDEMNAQILPEFATVGDLEGPGAWSRGRPRYTCVISET